MANFYGELVIRITSDTAGLKKGLAESAAGVEALGTKATKAGRFTAARMEHVGRQMQNVGRQMTQFVTLPIAAGFAIAGIAAFKYQDQLMKIQNLTGTTAAQTKAWGDELIRLGGVTGQTPIKLAESLYFVASSGFKGADAMKVIEVSAKAAAAGMGDVMVTADVLTSAMNAYGHSTYTAAEVTDYLMKTVEVGKAEPVALANSLGRIMPVAAQLKVGLDELGGNVAALTLGGLSSAEAVTALRGTMMALVAPAKMSIDQLKEMGFSYQEVTDSIAKKGLLPTLKKLWDATGHDMLAMRKIVPNVRALNGVLSLLGANYENNLKVIDKVGNAHGALDRAMKNTAQQPVQKLRQAWASLQGSFIKIGAVLLPFFAQVAGWLARLAESFTKISPGWRNFIMWALAAAAAIGPLVMVLGTLINGIGLLRGALGGLTLIKGVGAGLSTLFSGGGLVASVTAFGAALGPVTVGLLAVAAAIGVLYGAHKLFNWLDGTTERLKKMNAAVDLLEDPKVGEKLTKWSDKMAGGHLEKIGGRIVWTPVVEVKPKTPDVSGLVKWIHKQGQLARNAMREENKMNRIEIMRGNLATMQEMAQHAEMMSKISRVPSERTKWANLFGDYTKQAEAMGITLSQLTGQMSTLQEAGGKRVIFAAMVDREDAIGKQIKKVERLRALVKKDPGNIELGLRAEKAERGLANLKRELNDYKNKNWQAILDVRTEKATARLKAIDRHLKWLEKQKPSPEIDAQIEAFEKKRARVKARLEALDGMTVAPTIDANGQAAIDEAGRVQAALDALRDKWVTIHILKDKDIGVHSGGIVSGPHTGYPMTLHGRELVLPLDHPDLIPNLLRRAGLSDKGRRGPFNVSPQQRPVMAPAPARSATGGATEIHHHYNSSVSLPGSIVVDDTEKFAKRLAPHQENQLRITARRRQRGMATL
jgi:TP901 family phage tail tape measure protein